MANFVKPCFFPMLSLIIKGKSLFNHSIIWLCPSVVRSTSTSWLMKEAHVADLAYSLDHHHTIRRLSVCMPESQGGYPIGKALV